MSIFNAASLFLLQRFRNRSPNRNQDHDNENEEHDERMLRTNSGGIST